MMIEHFSTHSVLPEKRRNFWNEIVGATYDGLVVDPLRSQFHAKLSRWRLGEMMMMWPHSAAATIARNLHSSSHAKNQKLVLHILQGGECTVMHRGCEIKMSKGDVVICAGEEYYRINASEEHQMLVVEMDRSHIEQYSDRIEDTIAKRIRAEYAETRVLHNFLLSLWREGVADQGEDAGQSYSSVFAQLLVMTLSDRRSPEPAFRHPLLRRMATVVKARITDPEFSPGILAAELGVSIRSLQNAAAEAGTTPISYITACRLALAARKLLVEPETSVTHIAFAAGFSDSAYFTRRFREHYGMGPRDYRQCH